jgi:hypothetical protein
LPSNALVSIACLHPFDCRLSVQEPSVAVVEHSDINIFVADFELEVVEIPVIDYLDLASEYADEFVALLPLVVLQIVDTAMESGEHDVQNARFPNFEVFLPVGDFAKPRRTDGEDENLLVRRTFRSLNLINAFVAPHC